MEVSNPSLPSSPHPSLDVCSECLSMLIFACHGDKTPAHDPITGDLICHECQLKSRPNVLSNDYPLHARGLKASPLYLLANPLKANVEMKSEVSTIAMFDKCIHHINDDWVVVHMDELKCLCLTCSENQTSSNLLKGLGDARSIIRERLAIALITPLDNKGTLTNQIKQRKGVMLQHTRQEKINLIEATQRLSGVASVLDQWMNQVKEVNRMVCDKLSQIRSIISRDDEKDDTSTNQHVETILHDLDPFFQQACHIHINSLYPLIRIRHVISGTLLNGIRLLGLSISDNNDAGYQAYYTKEEVIKTLYKRPVNVGCVGEEVMILRCIECLRETLEKGDTLLLELTKEDVSGILSQVGGMKEGLDILFGQKNNVAFDVPISSARVLTKAKVMKGLVMKCVASLSLIHEPDYWLDGMLTWKEKEIEKQVALDACLNVLVYKDGTEKSLTHSTLKLIKESRPKIGEANALFLEGLQRHFGLRPAFKYFSEAEKKGCNHPLLCYYMGICYHSSGGVPRDVIKASECFGKAINGMFLWLDVHLYLTLHIPSVRHSHYYFKHALPANPMEPLLVYMAPRWIY